MATQGERTTALEVEVRNLKDQVEKLNKVADSIDAKLNRLDNLTHKGVGAFWFVSVILGSGILGSIGTIIDWFKHG